MVVVVVMRVGVGGVGGDQDIRPLQYRNNVVCHLYS